MSSANAFSIDVSWFVMTALGIFPPITCKNVRNIHSKVSTFSSFNKAHPNRKGVAWLFIPIIGTKGMLYISVL
ncbi:Os02g0284550 [Oryza sativa Japonica Group]|uniref:Os02g0284550 protein n=1 Tax=Oryza sativa subsp. japonica TaxID=39947 RepID=A0A0P0VHM8_ORYSJ|nr:hypothetical protein EE612_010487 [Oryza sativa]BAS78140.1 Os02g0284550 [Oryza sativa Japonica Group]